MNLSPDLQKLEARIGRLHLRQRLGMESDHAADLFGRGRTFFHIENWRSIHAVIRLLLRCTGLYWRGKRNALDIRIRRNVVELPRLPAAFDGFTLLHLSDLHLDINGDCTRALIERLRAVEYDICVMTGDFRARTYGTCDTALAELARMRPHLYQPVYAILGNHDSIRMVPPMEAMGITLLMNESAAIRRGGEAIYLVGIDDPHYFRMENFDKALREVPAGSVSVLLSHSPETYRRAAHGGIDLFLCGHTHGGQICLPGGLPLMTNADCPRRFCAGPWRYHGMQGYTSVGSGSSVVDVRFNCPPEITLHQLRRSAQ